MKTPTQSLTQTKQTQLMNHDNGIPVLQVTGRPSDKYFWEKLSMKIHHSNPSIENTGIVQKIAMASLILATLITQETARDNQS